MHAEFEAYIHAITEDHCGKEKSQSLFAEMGRTIVALYNDLLASAAPYYCELRPLKRVRGRAKALGG